jgi:glycosyltransferase involved in cell wall biosynthesis
MEKLVHHQRRPGPEHVSIERLFDGIRQNLPDPWHAEVALCPCPSRGIVARLRNMAEARKRAGKINHIVGDSHYLALGLPADGLVLTIHDCATLQRLRGAAREALRQLWFVQPMRRAVAVTTISHAIRDELRQWVGGLADKVRVIPNCVRSEFQPEPKAWPVREVVVLQVGTKWNKNVERVAEALAGTGCRLEIVGELSQAQREKVIATQTPFRELGRVSDVELLEAYRRSDLLVFASLYEGFGLPIIEAQALGRPVVTSNFGAMAEAAGPGAALVDPRDPAAIRREVLGILRSPGHRERLISEGFRNVGRYLPQVIASRYGCLYEEVAQVAPSR